MFIVQVLSPPVPQINHRVLHPFCGIPVAGHILILIRCHQEHNHIRVCTNTVIGTGLSWTFRQYFSGVKAPLPVPACVLSQALLERNQCILQCFFLGNRVTICVMYAVWISVLTNQWGNLFQIWHNSLSSTMFFVCVPTNQSAALHPFGRFLLVVISSLYMCIESAQTFRFCFWWEHHYRCWCLFWWADSSWLP